MKTSIESGYLNKQAVWQTHNIIVWLDGTVRPWIGHHNCDGYWEYDGQVFAFRCTCKD